MDSYNFAEMARLIALTLIPMLLGIICHEVAHGWVAYKMGDPTAKLLGRLTLNPVPHLDPMGTAFFVLTALAGAATAHPFLFGWAKPVPINARFFKDPRKGMMLSALAGPLTNLTLAFIFACLTIGMHRLILGQFLPVNSVSAYFARMLEFGVWINVTLACFNLLPIPPLDGSHILAGLLPPALVRPYYAVGRYGMLVLLLLLVSGVIGSVLGPSVSGIAHFMLENTPFAAF